MKRPPEYNVKKGIKRTEHCVWYVTFCVKTTTKKRKTDTFICLYMHKEAQGGRDWMEWE